jgi:hypothetical protein
MDSLRFLILIPLKDSYVQHNVLNYNELLTFRP